MTLPTGKQRQPSKGGFTPLEMKSLTGFTLIEVLAILLIVTVLIGLSLPRFSATTQNLQLTSSARSLAKLLTYAQERAIVERIPYQAVFDSTGKTYWLTRVESKGTETASSRIEGRYGRPVTLPSGISFRFPEEPIQFYPDGGSDPFTIELSTEGRRFILTDGVGHVRIQEEKS